MFRHLLKSGAVAAVLFFSHTGFAQEGQLIKLPTELLKKPVRSAGNYSASVDSEIQNSILSVNAVSCGTDTIVYPYLKELVFSAPNDSFFVDAMVGSMRSASQAYHLNSPVTIKGIQFWGAAYSFNNVPQTLEVKAYLYEIDAQNRPTRVLDSALVTVTDQYDFYEAIFENAYPYSSNFAVAIRSNINDTLAVQINNADAGWQNTQYGETLAWRRFGSGTWNSTLSFFGQDVEYMIFPIVEYEPTVDFTLSDDNACPGSSVSFLSTSSEIFSNRMFNLLAFDAYWLNIADSSLVWDFGDGSAKALGTNPSHTYTNPGTYTVTLTGKIVGYYAHCAFEKTAEVIVNTPVAISLQPKDSSVCPGSSAEFAVSVTGTSPLYQWQEFKENAFANIAEESLYSGTSSATLTINEGHNISENTYRIVVSNSCTEELISEEVSFIATDTKNPVFTTCPSDTVITTAIYEYDMPAGSDNCSSTGIERTEGLASGSEFPEGETVVTHKVTDLNGNENYCSFTVTRTLLTGIQKGGNIIEALYPNPASGVVNISLKSTAEVKIEVMNTSGLLMQEGKYNSDKVALDISGYSKGIYYVNIITEDIKETKKIVVQ